jgi:hypothetical protein
MVYSAHTKGVTMRHDMLLGAWRRIAHRAGVATAMEPAMEQLFAGTRASLKRCDMLVVLPDKGLVVTDVSVVHPAANSFLQQHLQQVQQPPPEHDKIPQIRRWLAGFWWLLFPLIRGALQTPGKAVDAVSAHPGQRLCLHCNCWV